MRTWLKGGLARWGSLLVVGVALLLFAERRTRADFITDHLAGPAVRVHGSGADGTLNIVILGDGFTADAASMAAYRAEADRAVSELLAADPFQALAAALTIYRVDVISDEAGIDVPADCGGVPYDPVPPFTFARSEKHPNNALETHWCESGVKWFLGSDAGSDRVAQFALTSGVVPDITMVLVNDWMFGATAWADPGVLFVSISRNLVGDLNPDTNSLLQPNDPGSFPAVSVHEMGHMAPFRLLDEYSKGRDPAELNADEQALISGSPNLELNQSTPKWADLLTPDSPDCAEADPPQVGAVAGGRGFDAGVFHPQCACRMNAYSHPTFCVVCRRRLLRSLTRHLSVLNYVPPRKDPRSREPLWAYVDSLVLRNGPSGRYVLEYAISFQGQRAQGLWPGREGVRLRAGKTALVGEFLVLPGIGFDPSRPATPDGRSGPVVTVEYRLQWRPLGDDSDHPTTLAEEQHQIPLSLLRSGLVAIDRPTHRITIAVAGPR